MKLKRIAMGLIMALIYLLTICINVSAYGEISKRADLTISNLKELVAFRDSVNNGNTYEGKTVRLLKDIDMSSINNWEPIGRPQKPFSGTFDGNNKTISNINIINNNASLTHLGLFGATYGSYSNYVTSLGSAEMKNLNIKNVNIISNGDEVGGLTGYFKYYVISNCTVTNAKINGRGYVGGIAGICYNSKINNCSSSAVVTGYGSIGGLVGHAGDSIIEKSNATGNISGDGMVGGLIGYEGNSYILDCFATGNVNGDLFYVGGLIGEAGLNKISNCYSTGNITGESKYCGGFIGHAAVVSIINCFSTGNVLGIDIVGGFCGDVSSCPTFVNNYYNSDSNKNPFGLDYARWHYDVKGKSLTSMKDQSFASELNDPIPENIAKVLKENHITVYKYNWKYGENDNLPFIDSTLPYLK